MKMITRRFFVVLAVLAGLFAFQGSIADATPREKARIELVEKLRAEKEERSVASIGNPYKVEFPSSFYQKTLQKPQVFRPLLVTLVISSLHHHSSL